MYIKPYKADAVAIWFLHFDLREKVQSFSCKHKGTLRHRIYFFGPPWKYILSDIFL